MKKFLILLLTCLLVLACLTVAWAEDTSRSYLFALSVDGKDTHLAQNGDILTVTFHLRRTDSAETAPMYAMQNEITYDGAFFQLVEGSILASQSIRTTQVSEPDGTQRLYMNFLSTVGGEEWPADRLVGSFQLRVIGTDGARSVTNENYLVSTWDGRERYTAAVQDVTVALNEQALQETVRAQADGAVSHLPVGLWFAVAAVTALLLLYDRVKLRRR